MAPQVFIRSLELKNWRNFRSARVDFQPRTFIVGPNASGKSNLLDAIRFLRDVAEEDAGLQRAVKKRGGFSAVRTLFSHGRDSSVQLKLKCAIASVEWEYSLALQSDANDRAVVQHETIRRADALLLERSVTSEREEAKRQTLLQQTGSGESFEPLREGLRKIRYAHLAPELLRTTKFHGDMDLEDFGSRFLERVFLTPKAARDQKLQQVNSALKGLLPYFEKLDVERDQLGGYHLSLKVKHWRAHAGTQNEVALSDGTLRVIALLWEILDGEGPLLLEEPELSLHAAAVAKLPALFAKLIQRDRQLILSTHAFSMFREVGIAAEELVLIRASKSKKKAEASTVTVGSAEKHIVDSLKHQLSLEPVLETLTAPPAPQKLADISF